MPGLDQTVPDGHAPDDRVQDRDALGEDAAADHVPDAPEPDEDAAVDRVPDAPGRDEDAAADHVPDGDAAADHVPDAPALGEDAAADHVPDGVVPDDPSLEWAMRLALDEACAAVHHGDVPVGAVVVRAGAVIAARHNERELTGDPTAHAEILALRDAAACVGHWRLDDCTIVVTLEPCAMCAGAMVNGRVGRLVYGASDPKAGAAGSCFDLVDSTLLNHRIPRTTGVLADQCGRLLTEFFAERRRPADR